MKLHQLGEDRLLARLLPALRKGRDVIAAAGDDVAVVDPFAGDNFLLLKTDCVVEKVHFQTTAPPDSIGWKAMMRPLSDFAAVAGVPRFALITLVIARDKESEWVEKIYRGLRRAAARFDVSIVGGETSSTRGPTVISIAVSGFVERNRWVSRAGGKPGDHLFVTGRLGGSGKGKHLRFVPRIKEARWLSKNFRLHAMIDLSDGLGVDLPRLGRASRSGFDVAVERIPRAAGAGVENAISDGEDYELLFAVSPKDSARLPATWRKKFPRLKITDIGRLLSDRRSLWSGRRRPDRGYIHFQ